MSHPTHSSEPQPFVQYSAASLGYNVSVRGPASAADFDRLVGKPNAAVSEAMTQWFYRTGLPRFRELFSKRLESESGIPRLFKTVTAKRGEDAGKEITKYDETEQDYINRLEAGVTDPAGAILYKLDAGDALKWAAEVNEELGDWSPNDGVSDRKPAARFYDEARQYLSRVQAGRYGIEHVVTVLEGQTNMPFATTWGEPNEDNIARCLKFLEEKIKRDKANLL